MIYVHYAKCITLYTEWNSWYIDNVANKFRLIAYLEKLLGKVVSIAQFPYDKPEIILFKVLFYCIKHFQIKRILLNLKMLRCIKRKNLFFIDFIFLQRYTWCGKYFENGRQVSWRYLCTQKQVDTKNSYKMYHIGSCDINSNL